MDISIIYYSIESLNIILLLKYLILLISMTKHYSKKSKPIPIKMFKYYLVKNKKKETLT